MKYARLSRSFSTIRSQRHPDNIMHLVKNYPLLLDFDGRRETSLEKRIGTESFFQRLGLRFKGAVQNFFLKETLTKRIDYPEKVGDYISSFKIGVTLAAQALFSALKAENDGIPLMNFLKPSLYDAIAKHNQDIKDTGSVINLNLNELKFKNLGDAYISYGDDVSTTLEPGRIKFKANDPSLFIKETEMGDSLNDLYFEFRFPKGTSGANDLYPDKAILREIAIKGQCMAINAIFDISYDFSVVQADQKMISKTVKREFLVRFETENFKGKYKGQWKIADVDNYLASRQFGESPLTQ